MPAPGRPVTAPVVDAGWLRQHRDDVVLADVRWYLDGRAGRDAYDAGHLPGAVFVDLDRWLAGDPGPDVGRHPLPDPQVFARGMAGLGISDDDVVVAYDDAGGVVAARLVWLLRVTGHDAALLDGGLAAAGGGLETRPVERPEGSFTTRPWPSGRLADVDEAVAVPAAGGVLLDARTAERYRGDEEPVDPRAGHIPGARNLSVRDALAPDGTFLPVAELRERFASVGVTEGTDVVAYCGSGVTACHELLTLEHAGLGEGRLYPGSWSQYSADPARPVATGPAEQR